MRRAGSSSACKVDNAHKVCTASLPRGCPGGAACTEPRGRQSCNTKPAFAHLAAETRLPGGRWEEPRACRLPTSPSRKWPPVFANTVEWPARASPQPRRAALRLGGLPSRARPCSFHCSEWVRNAKPPFCAWGSFSLPPSSPPPPANHLPAETKEGSGVRADSPARSQGGNTSPPPGVWECSLVRGHAHTCMPARQPRTLA